MIRPFPLFRPWGPPMGRTSIDRRIKIKEPKGDLVIICGDHGKQVAFRGGCPKCNAPVILAKKERA